MKLTRTKPGYYTAQNNGHSVVIYKVTARGQEGGRCTGWNLSIDGKVVSDWLPSCKCAASKVERLTAKTPYQHFAEESK